MSRLPLGALGALGALVVGVVLAAAVSAHAAGPGGGVACPPTKLNCDIRADDGKPGQSVGKPGQGPGKPGGDGSGKPSCAIDGTPVPCSTPEMGVFSPAGSCCWRPLDTPPALPAGFDTGAPAGRKPGVPGGSLYLVTCPNSAGDEIRGGLRWSATSPAGGGVQALAQQAVEKLRLEGPDIGIVPRPDGTGLVGMPVWMWSNPSPSHTGPTSASAWWQHLVRKRAPEQAARQTGLVIETRALFGFTAAPGTTADGRMRRITQHLPPEFASRLLAAQDAGASEAELQQVAADGLQEVYFKDSGSRAQALLVEFTDIDYIDVAY
ncbi:telomere-protecting terminal protein Tpg [Streptomyces sp. NPDC093093]|uniref:telomere-protecting terminal protein Tpg n=1 Tax=Streptomyces sp. NPDC093093 TaxID=3366025 RepID=UPI0037F3BC3C